MEKNEIRNTIKSRRNLLSPTEIREKSKILREKLFDLIEFRNAKNIFIYLSFGSEVRTDEIIETCFNLGKKVLVPTVNNHTNQLMVCEFLGFDKLKKSDFGVMEPTPVKLFPIKDLDLILVPGIAFDENFNRVGFGKGFFDKFLSQIPNSVPTIALAFELQIVKTVPVNSEDIKVQKIVTEKRVI